MNEFDNLIYQAFDELESERLKVIDAYEDPLAKLSRRYQRCIARLCSSSERRPLLSRPAAKRLVAAMLILVLLSTTVIGVKAIRVPIVDFFTRVVGRWLYAEYDPNSIENAPKMLESIYFPQYIPEGYTLTEEERGYLLYSVEWENSQKVSISFYQHTLHGEFGFNSEHTMEVFIGETHVLYNKGVGVSSYYWNNDEYGFSFSIWGDMSPEEVEKMIASVTKIE